MGLQSQQTFLARLFTDEKLCQNFLSEPNKVGIENGLNESDILQLKEILPEQLRFFANSLFYKRISEVEKFLPLTQQVLNTQFIELFRDFSQVFTPKSIKKHLEDAIEFVDFLNEQNVKPQWAKDLARFEQTQLIFNGYHKNFTLKIFDFDIRQILREVSHNHKVSQIEFQPGKTLAVWLRIGKKTRHFIL